MLGHKYYHVTIEKVGATSGLSIASEAEENGTKYGILLPTNGGFNSDVSVKSTDCMAQGSTN